MLQQRSEIIIRQVPFDKSEIKNNAQKENKWSEAPIYFKNGNKKDL